MKKYKDTDNDSNISGYEYGDNWITIYFKGDSEYDYSTEKVSQYTINQMKLLADEGDGLNAFINKNKPPYKSKR